jgi:hypothetical protein
MLVGHARRRAAFGIDGPGFRQLDRAGDQGRSPMGSGTSPPARVGETSTWPLARLPEAAAVRAGHPDRMLAPRSSPGQALPGQGGVVNDEHGIRAADDVLERVVTLQAEPPWAAGSRHSPDPSRPRR